MDEPRQESTPYEELRVAAQEAKAERNQSYRELQDAARTVNADQGWRYVAPPRQNAAVGFFGGVIAAIVGAALWAVVTVSIELQCAWMAVILGVIVGSTVNNMGMGSSAVFGGIGAICSLFGCVLGNLLSACGFVAIQQSKPFFEVAQIALMNPSIAFKMHVALFHPLDLLFYAGALYTGYRCSIWKPPKA